MHGGRVNHQTTRSIILASDNGAGLDLGEIQARVSVSWDNGITYAPYTEINQF